VKFAAPAAVVILTVSLAVPSVARAGVFSFISGLLGSDSSAFQVASAANSQSLDLLQADVKPNQDNATGGADITIVDGSALAADASPSSSEDHDAPHRPGSDQISVYVVRDGDTLSQIADMFNVSVNTIMWSNNLTSKTVQPGQVLVILPVSGIKYTVKKGDTIASIAKDYNGDVDDIKSYNNISSDSQLAVGSSVIIPNGEVSAPVGTVATKSTKTNNSSSSSSSAKSSPSSSSSSSSAAPIAKSMIGGAHAAPIPAASSASGDTSGYYMRPLKGGVKTQGIHGYNAVDIGTPVGTTIYAAASGNVIVSKDSGWNGGYGNYVVISHPNGTQTLYAHLTSTIVVAGQHVVQGQVIGYSGSTGDSTGPHLHFEVRGAVNPF